MDAELLRYEQIRQRLGHAIGALDRSRPTTTDALIEILEAMKMYEEHLHPDQMSRLDDQRALLGFPGLVRWRAEAGEAIAALRRSLESGADPSDDEVQRTVLEIHRLRRQFTTDDPEIIENLTKVHGDPKWDQLRNLIPQDAELRAFWKEAKASSST